MSRSVVSSRRFLVLRFAVLLSLLGLLVGCAGQSGEVTPEATESRQTSAAGSVAATASKTTPTPGAPAPVSPPAPVETPSDEPAVPPIGYAPTPDLVPPVLVAKEANRWAEPPAGVVATLNAPTSTTFVLYIPERVVLDADNATTLTLHFHGAAWFIQQEHARRGAAFPLIVANAKEGDAVFETDILRPGVLASLLGQADDHLKRAIGNPKAHVARLEVSGFSAGYAGVRGVLRDEQFERMVARVMLNDSLYVGDAPDSVKPDKRKPRRGPDGIDPFIDFARKAATGKRTFLMEHSSTPSMRSVGPTDCSFAILAALGVPIREVAPNSIPAARETADFRLMWRADAGNAHFWCYRAEERPIHLAHVRNQGEMWRALDGLTSLDAVPPPAPPRAIRPGDQPPPGDTTLLDIGTTGVVTLFVPASYKVPKNGEVEITVHFHGASWFVIQEHQARGNGDPIVTLELGQGSTVYRVPFEDPARFSRMLDAVTRELVSYGATPETRVTSVNITSFSAGYGAVREIVKSPENVAVIKRIVLADSSYGGLDEEALKDGKRVVAPEYIEPWLAYARLAVAGEKTLLMTTSNITPPTYAGTYEVAAAVAKTLGVDVKDVAAGSCPASAIDQPYPLQKRADAGSFHWWAYGGVDAVVHMTLARHIADDWAALDQCGDR